MKFVTPARILILLHFYLLFLSSCSSSRRAERFYAKTISKEIRNSPVFANSFTGFTLLDPETGKVLCDVNSDHFFTPASNTKILTLYTCLKVLGDSLPGMQFAFADSTNLYPKRKTLFLRGTGNPTFLHPAFKAWQPVLLDFFNRQQGVPVIFSGKRFLEKRFGPGWAWDDFNDNYSAERSSMPLFGNLIWFEKTDSNWNVQPKRYRGWMKTIDGPDFQDGLLRRLENEDRIEVPKKFRFRAGYRQQIPIREPERWLGYNLLDTLPYLSIQNLPYGGFSGDDGYPTPELHWQTIYTIPVDTVYRRMMYQSDNFMAEQLLLVCAGVKFDTLQEDKIICWAQDSLFQSLPQKPRWVDGSGLSRYNLNTPRNNAEILRMLWTEQPHERLFNLFPTGGAAGTLSNWYKSPGGKSYIFAKSGSMSGVQCLSGYLITRQGKVLIFSFMHNNFVGSGKPWKLEMQRIFELIRDSKK